MPTLVNMLKKFNLGRLQKPVISILSQPAKRFNYHRLVVYWKIFIPIF
jgi:hypothetical protein